MVGESGRKKLSKTSDKRKAYLSRQVKEMQTELKPSVEYAFRLLKSLVGRQSEIARDRCRRRGFTYRFERGGENGREPVATPRVSNAQRIRLYPQAMTTEEIGKQEHDPGSDLLQLRHLGDAPRVMDDDVPLGTNHAEPKRRRGNEFGAM